jgi:hypothetical protein
MGNRIMNVFLFTQFFVIVFSSLGYDEAFTLASSGKMDGEILQAFRDHYLARVKMFNHRPTAKVYEGRNLMLALINMGSQSPSNARALLEEAIMLGQDLLTMIPQDRLAKHNLQTAQRNYFEQCRKDSHPLTNNSLDLDFVELGTSDYDLLTAQTGAEQLKGVSVEPVSYYLNKLPTHKNLKKVRAAIVSEYNDEARSTKMFFVSTELLVMHPDWPEWVRGCNSVGKPHSSAVSFLYSQGYDPMLHILSEDVDLISIHDLLKEVGGCRVGFLKMDVEGFDPALLIAYARYLAQYPSCYADRVQVEFNEQSGRRLQVRALRYIAMFGYSESHLTGDDIILFYSEKDDMRRAK